MNLAKPTQTLARLTESESGVALAEGAEHLAQATAQGAARLVNETLETLMARPKAAVKVETTVTLETSPQSNPLKSASNR